jgi:hypothetical protein
VSGEVHLWEIGAGERLGSIPQAHLDLESRLEEWLEADISILDPGLLVIGRQVETGFTGCIDLLAVDDEGDLVIVELKRDKTPREVTAQALEYASFVFNLSHEQVTSIAEKHLDTDFASAFQAKFGIDVPDTLNGDHRILIVGSVIDTRSERIIRYLSGVHGVNINAATFNYFHLEDGKELLARIFLIEPSEVELKNRTRSGSKRNPKLTDEELEAQAEDAGVADLYRYAVTELSSVLNRHNLVTGIGFNARVNGSTKSVLMLGPAESHEGALRYWIYKNRYAEVAHLPSEEADALMPAEEKQPYLPDNPDYNGYQGVITSTDEIDRLVQPLRSNGIPQAAPALAS